MLDYEIINDETQPFQIGDNVKLIKRPEGYDECLLATYTLYYDIMSQRNGIGVVVDADVKRRGCVDNTIYVSWGLCNIKFYRSIVPIDCIEIYTGVST